MSEKRFKGYAEKTGQHFELIINDLLGEEYSLTDDFFKSKEVIFEIVDLLNEMFEKLNKKQEKSVELFFKYKKLKEENEQLKCMNNQLERRLDYSIAYDMGECE